MKLLVSIILFFSLLERSPTSDAIDGANANIFSKTFQLVYDDLQSAVREMRKLTNF